MGDPTGHYVVETGSGTVAHIIDMDTGESEDDGPFSLGPSAPGEKMCSRGNRHFQDQRVPFSAFVEHHEIDKDGFEGDAPAEICSYCWSNTIEALEETQEGDDDISKRIGNVGYRLRWKQKGRAREEWYDIGVSPEATMAELDRLVCRFTTLDDFHLRMYGLEDEYLDSSLKILPDHQCEQAGDPSYTKARMRERLCTTTSGRSTDCSTMLLVAAGWSNTTRISISLSISTSPRHTGSVAASRRRRRFTGRLLRLSVRI